MRPKSDLKHLKNSFKHIWKAFEKKGFGRKDHHLGPRMLIMGPPPCDTRTFAQGFGGSLENLQGPMYKVLEPL